MSVEAVDWALFNAPMLLTEKGNPDSTARQVLAVLAVHAGKTGHDARPSVLRVRLATGLDERTIQRALARLEKGGQVSRTGVHESGTVIWRLHMDRTRPESDWEQMRAEADEVRRVESERRRERRHKAAETVSGTETPGQAEDVRDAESRRPARKVPASGTENPDVRDAAPPEPYLEPSLNRQEPSSLSSGEHLASSAAALEDRERDDSDPEESQEPLSVYERLLARHGVTDRERAGALIYGADQLPGGDKGIGWWRKVAATGDLTDVIEEIESRYPAVADARPHPNAHPYEPDPSDKFCERCYTGKTNARHKVPDPYELDLSRLDRPRGRRTGTRHEPFRNPDPADYHQPL